ncbi:AMP-binding protein [Salicibibacter cibarius]|uniref:AMP-binding protein n=1 Tax=Salicibibacter cibarius TaxID=2743000 RepID=A0A7T7CC21_9BACI|nr:AMP-binding protein [Salicibibacter cibarius]QQK76445.1 AMP-binding protein [Salicibibacter cibarius]
MHLGKLFERSAENFGELEMVTDGEYQATYHEELERTQRLASAMKAAGVQKNDRVAFIDTNRYEFFEILFATVSLGAVFVPINYRAKAQELEYMLDRVDIKMVFVGERYYPMVQQVKRHVLSLENVVLFEGDHEDAIFYKDLLKRGVQTKSAHEGTEEDLAVLLFTSGTTSHPKPVMLTHQAVYNFLNVYPSSENKEQEVLLQHVPNFHVAGLLNAIIGIYKGVRFVLIPQFDAQVWLEKVHTEKCTRTFLTPTMMKHVLDHKEFDRYDLSSLKLVTYGSAPASITIIEETMRRFPETTDFSHAFGMTETMSTVTALGPSDHQLSGTGEALEKQKKRLHSVGRPLPDVRIRICDEKGNVLPPEKVGRVELLTLRTMAGYLGDETSTQQAFTSDGWFQSSDMGYLDEDGYLYIMGRSDELIIRGGENISPLEVEGVISQHPEVHEVSVIPVPSLEWGQEVMAIIVPKDENNQPDAEAIIQYCRENMTSFKKPGYVTFVSELPRNSTGKILKNVLKEQYTANNKNYEHMKGR